MKRLAALFFFASALIAMGVGGVTYYGAFNDANAKSFIVDVQTNNWVKINGTETNFPSSQTAGIQECWTIYTNSLPQNYGPVFSGIEYDFSANYTYIHVPMVLSNQFCSSVRFKGQSQNGSRVVFDGTSVGTTWLTITGQQHNSLSTGAYPVHVFADHIGFTATNNVTNVLMEIDNDAWIDFDSVDFRGWQMLTNQINGVSLSQNVPAGVTPNLGGLIVNTSGEHLTSFRYVSFAGLAWGADIQCDHLMVVEEKPTYIGWNYSNSVTAYGNNGWATYTPRWYSPLMIRRGGIDTTIYGGHNYGTGAFMLCAGATGPIRLHEYVEESASAYADFMTDSDIPTIDNLIIQNTGLPYTLLLTQYTNGQYVPTSCIQTPVSGFGGSPNKVIGGNNYLTSSQWGITQQGGSFWIDTNGIINGLGQNISNLTVPYLTGVVSNANGQTVLPYFTTSNSIITNLGTIYNPPGSAGTFYPGQGFVVSGAGTAAVNGTYLPSFLNTIQSNTGCTVLGYFVYTNTANGSVLAFNEPGYVSQSAYVFESQVGGGGTIYYSSSSNRRANPLTCNWTVVSGISTGPTSVAPYNPQITYANDLVVAGTVTGVTTNYTILAGSTLYITNGIIGAIH